MNTLGEGTPKLNLKTSFDKKKVGWQYEWGVFQKKKTVKSKR